jgi:hypothetical protein
MKEYRGYISEDGTCFNNLNDVIGFIDGDNAGNVDQEYLGAVSGRDSHEIEVQDALDERLGTVDLGRAHFKNSAGSTVVEVENSGVVTGHAGTYLGQFEGFTFHDIKKIALYLFLVDPGMVSEIEG